MTTSTIIWIVVVVIAAVSLIAAIAWVARNKRTEHRRVQPATSARKPSNSPTRWGNGKRLPTRRQPRPALRKPRPKPWQRTRQAYNIRRKHVAPTRPPPAAS